VGPDRGTASGVFQPGVRELPHSSGLQCNLIGKRSNTGAASIHLRRQKTKVPARKFKNRLFYTRQSGWFWTKIGKSEDELSWLQTPTSLPHR
jgi:hypothetical protein